VGLNRRLAHEMARVGADRWEVTAVAPTRFQGTRDLRPVELKLAEHEPCPVVPVRAYLTSQVHCFWYGTGLKRLMSRPWDMVHCWEEPYVVAGWQVAHSAPPRTRVAIVTAQNWSKSYPPPFGWIERSNIRRSSGWIAFGRTIHDALKDRAGYGERPGRIIPMGVDTELFQPAPATGRAVRERLGWKLSGPPVVGYLGRFVPEKGVRLLMTALDRVATPWRALFVGAGPLEPELRAWAAKHSDSVRVCSNVRHDEVPNYLNAMDMLCAPSQTTPRWREQFGRMLIEGFACGLPVIGSDSGEIPFVLGKEGVVVSESDVDAWANRVGGLLDSPDRRRELGLIGRARSLQEFAWPVVARHHLEFFDQLCDSPRPAR
jgi:glycosyltransferase involved in cell wall biosynthesis